MPRSPRCADLAEQPRRPILGSSGRVSAAEGPLPEPRAAGTAEAGGRSVLEGPVMTRRVGTGIARASVPPCPGWYCTVCLYRLVAQLCALSLFWRGLFVESGLLENEPTAPAEQAHTTRRQ